MKRKPEPGGPSLVPPTEKREAGFAVFEKEFAQKILRDIQTNTNFEYFVSGTGKSREKVDRVVFEREMAFCRHMIESLLVCKRLASGENSEDGVLSIQLNTSMLYDVDETLATSKHDLKVRPSAKYLFGYLKSCGVDIGLCTTRDKEDVNAQLESAAVDGSIEEIGEYVDKKRIYNVKDIDGNSRGDDSYELIPGFKVLRTKEEVMMEVLNISRAELVQLLDVELLQLVEAIEQKRANDPDDYMYKDMSDIEKRSQVQEVVSAFKNYNLSAKIGSLRFLIEDGEKFGIDKQLPSLAILFENWNKIDDEEKEIYRLQNKNAGILDVFFTRANDVLGLDGEDGTTFSLLLARTMRAYEELKSSQSERVVIAVDNVPMAEKLFLLLSGQYVGKDGKVVVPNELLNIPEKYRNKFFIISCGQRGEYEAGFIEKDIELVA